MSNIKNIISTVNYIFFVILILFFLYMFLYKFVTNDYFFCYFVFVVQC